MMRRPPRSPLFPYTTLSRSAFRDGSRPLAAIPRRGACRSHRSEEHTSELQSRVDISYAVFCLKKKTSTLRPRTYPRRFRHSPPSQQPHTLRGRGGLVKTQPRPVNDLVAASCVFFFNDTATTEIYTLSLHDALPICAGTRRSPCAGIQSVLAS